MAKKLVLQAIVTTILLPGSGIFLIPWFIIHPAVKSNWPAFSGLNIILTVIAIAALAALLHCIWGFAVHGRGTLAPINPPEILVLHGFYRYTRNPMYLSIICILFIETLLFSNVSMLIYAVLVFTGFHLFVIHYEEPRLHSQFGDSYQEYTHKVPRWGIIIKPYN